MIDVDLCTCTNSSYLKGDKTIVRFNESSGVSGKAFSEDKIIIRNGDRLENSLFELDIFSSHRNIKSFAFIPLHNSNGQKVGLLQLFNKKGSDIDNGDLKLFRSIQMIFGQLIENTIKLNEALDFYLNAKNVTTAIAQDISFPDSQSLVTLFIIPKIKDCEQGLMKAETILRAVNGISKRITAKQFAQLNNQ